MIKTPKSMRLTIALFGRCNVGKSALLNAITQQNISIVSNFAGTTTDPVEKPMELLPIGPVVFIDTAGIDDLGAIGDLRVKRTKKIYERADIAIIITEADCWDKYEIDTLNDLTLKKIPVIVVLNKIDEIKPKDEILMNLEKQKIRVVLVSAIKKKGIFNLRQALVDLAPTDFFVNRIASDIVGPGELAVLVVPIDKEAPKGRLIMPQVQTIRDLLDGQAYCMVVRERELTIALQNLKKPPKLIITDSSCFLKVAADVEKDILMTSFSILFAKLKGDLLYQTISVLAIENLHAQDKILICEACTHHPITDDIGRVKIPRWLEQYVGTKLDFEIFSGHDFPSDLRRYKFVIHCGGCMLNRREILNRILICQEQNIPCTNYGIIIAYTLGILERTLKPFPYILEIFKAEKRRRLKTN